MTEVRAGWLLYFSRHSLPIGIQSAVAKFTASPQLKPREKPAWNAWSGDALSEMVGRSNFPSLHTPLPSPPLPSPPHSTPPHPTPLPSPPLHPLAPTPTFGKVMTKVPGSCTRRTTRTPSAMSVSGETIVVSAYIRSGSCLKRFTLRSRSTDSSLPASSPDTPYHTFFAP